MLLLRTGKWVELEGAIHRTLKLRGRLLEKLQGAEWFNTNPDEVLKIYDFIIYGKANMTRQREITDNRKAEKRRKRQLESLNRGTSASKEEPSLGDKSD